MVLQSRTARVRATRQWSAPVAAACDVGGCRSGDRLWGAAETRALPASPTVAWTMGGAGGLKAVGQRKRRKWMEEGGFGRGVARGGGADKPCHGETGGWCSGAQIGGIGDRRCPWQAAGGRRRPQ